jgi:small subunit ribosomal protein S7
MARPSRGDGEYRSQLEKAVRAAAHDRGNEMPRRSKVERRVPAPDARFNSEVLARFINKVMERGKKGTAEHIVYGALNRIAERTGRNPLEVFEQALGNATPVIEVKPRRVGGATYQVPVQIEGPRRQSLAMRWLLLSARSRPGRSMQEKLANELLDAFNNTGATIKRREDTHRMAEANRAFSHYGRF